MLRTDIARKTSAKPRKYGRSEKKKTPSLTSSCATPGGTVRQIDEETCRLASRNGCKGLTTHETNAHARASKPHRLDPATSILEMRSFSTARSTPSLQRTPRAVPEFSTALVAYST